eukprot:COSAG01_NODE_1553_length_9931_cov_3.092657_2_plen_60_part_00
MVDSVVDGGAGAADTLVAPVPGADAARLCWLPKAAAAAAAAAAAGRSAGAQTAAAAFCS